VHNGIPGDRRCSGQIDRVDADVRARRHHDAGREALRRGARPVLSGVKARRLPGRRAVTRETPGRRHRPGACHAVRSSHPEGERDALLSPNARAPTGPVTIVTTGATSSSSSVCTRRAQQVPSAPASTPHCRGPRADRRRSRPSRTPASTCSCCARGSNAEAAARVRYPTAHGAAAASRRRQAKTRIVFHKQGPEGIEHPHSSAIRPQSANPQPPPHAPAVPPQTGSEAQIE